MQNERYKQAMEMQTFYIDQISNLKKIIEIYQGQVKIKDFFFNFFYLNKDGPIEKGINNLW